jgi:hypothetical protein
MLVYTKSLTWFCPTKAEVVEEGQDDAETKEAAHEEAAKIAERRQRVRSILSRAPKAYEDGAWSHQSINTSHNIVAQVAHHESSSERRPLVGPHPVHHDPPEGSTLVSPRNQYNSM